MDTILAFIIYLTLFRLTIIIAGIICIVLGYRLFCRGVWPIHGQDRGTSVEAEFDGSRLTLKNAAPGTCFALFGAIIIGVMFWAGSPEGIFEETKSILRGKTPFPAETQGDTTQDLAISALTQEGINFEKNNNKEKAKEKYLEAVILAVEPMNGLAWLYQQEGKIKEALTLAQLVAQVRPEEVRFLDTLAVVLCKSGDHKAAIHFMEKATKLDSAKFSKKLSRFKTGGCI
ncbi:MAG: hypothetical protein KC643_22095 [Nitrospira sp.]|nr:hypothetical protein [Nitrospira sp.]